MRGILPLLGSKASDAAKYAHGVEIIEDVVDEYQQNDHPTQIVDKEVAIFHRLIVIVTPKLRKILNLYTSFLAAITNKKARSRGLRQAFLG